MIEIKDDPSCLRVDEYGSVRVGRSNVLLDLVIQHHRGGRAPADIVESFPTLKLADVYEAIAYYLNHRDDVDEYLEEGERIAAKWIARIEADPRHWEERRRIDAILEERHVPVGG